MTCTPIRTTNKMHPHYSWPATLRLPTGVRLVYLDLNHWISIAKVLAPLGTPTATGIATGVCQLSRSVEQRSLTKHVFPVSLPIYVQRDTRSVVAAAVARTSGRPLSTDGRFFVVTSRHVIATHEIEALLDTLIGPNPEPVNSMDYQIGASFAH